MITLVQLVSPEPTPPPIPGLVSFVSGIAWGGTAFACVAMTVVLVAVLLPDLSPVMGRTAVVIASLGFGMSLVGFVVDETRPVITTIACGVLVILIGGGISYLRRRSR